MEKILLLGSNGFIGRNLESYFSNRENTMLLSPKRGDLNLLDEASCRDFLKKEKPNKIVYSAVNLTSLDDTLRMFFNIYQNREYYGFLYNIGSGAEYDKRSYIPLMKEDYFGTFVPVDTYGLGKYLISREIESARGNAINLRVFAIYGKHEDYSRRFISNNICRVLGGKPISINKNIPFDYIHVDDFCHILDRMMNVTPAFFNYNVCSGSPVGLLDLGQKIADQMGVDQIVSPKESGNGAEYSGDNSRLIDEIGRVEYKPVQIGIDELINWYRKCDSDGQLNYESL